MNLDPALLEIIVCPDCRGALAVDEAASELVCTVLRAAPTRSATTSRCCWSTRPAAPRRARPASWPSCSTTPASTTRPRWPRPTTVLRPLAEAGRPGPPRGRRRRRGDRGGGGRRRRRVPPAGRGRGRPRLPAAAGGARAVVPGAVRGLARARRCPAGPAASTWSWCSRPRAATPARRPRSPRRSAAAAASWSPARRGSLVAEHAAGRDSTVLPCASGDQLATAVVMLRVPRPARPRARTPTPRRWPQALDDVAIACSPYRDLAVNPAKMLAIALADSTPLVWGGSVLAARAARRVAESIRRASGRTALAGDAEHLLPVIAAARPRDVFADPFDDDEGAGRRPALVVLDDGADDAAIREQRGRLRAEAAGPHGVRVETVCQRGRQRRRPLRRAARHRHLRRGLPRRRPG